MPVLNSSRDTISASGSTTIASSASADEDVFGAAEESPQGAVPVVAGWFCWLDRCARNSSLFLMTRSKISVGHHVTPHLVGELGGGRDPLRRVRAVADLEHLEPLVLHGGDGELIHRGDPGPELGADLAGGGEHRRAMLRDRPSPRCACPPPPRRPAAPGRCRSCWGASLNHCRPSAASGGASMVSIMPVRRPWSASGSASATGLKPLLLHHWIMRSLPAQVKILSLRRSSRRVDRGLGEEVHPAHVAPGEQDEALLVEALGQERRHVVEHVVELVPGIEEERDLEDAEVVVDVGEAGDGDRAGVELPDADLADDVGLVALHAARVDHQRDVAAADGLPLGAEVGQQLVKGRVRRESRWRA